VERIGMREVGEREERIQTKEEMRRILSNKSQERIIEFRKKEKKKERKKVLF